jgi:Xaa-Pro aminopeptidase
MASFTNMFAKNRQAIVDMLPDKSVVLLFAAPLKIRSWDSHYPYCQDKNFYYLTGYEHRSAAVLITKNGSSIATTLFVIKLTPSQIHWTGSLPTPEEAAHITGIHTVLALDKLDYHLSALLKHSDHLFLDFHPVTSDEPLTDALQFAEKIRRRNPHVSIHRIHDLMARLREIKSPEEIETIGEAIRLTHKGIDRLLNAVRPGVPEYEIEAFFNFELHLHRTIPAFPSIVATGKNATVLHYNAMGDTLKNGDLVLLDLGAEFEHYSADISRTFPVNGRFSPKQRDLYSLVLEANIRTIEAVKPGLTLASLNGITKTILAEGLKKLGYLKDLQDVSKFFTHGVSHSLGLDTHDIISRNMDTLQPGMVITIEPGLYLHEENTGIRIEDDILVTETGCRNLSIDIPKTIDAIENRMTVLQS